MGACVLVFFRKLFPFIYHTSETSGITTPNLSSRLQLTLCCLSIAFSRYFAIFSVISIGCLSQGTENISETVSKLLKFGPNGANVFL